jgi:hypothetical protein
MNRIILSCLGFFLLLTGFSEADMGYFASIAQNPVPAGVPGWHPSIEMTAEDVLIQLGYRGQARITADFLFTNRGEAETVVMYFPVTVMNPQISALWSLEDISYPLDTPIVTVDGEAAEVFPLLRSRWYPETGFLTWEDIEKFATPLTASEPDTGETFFYIMDPSCWGNLTMDFISELDTPDIMAMEADAMMAAWAVEFEEGQQVLVEYSLDFTMSSYYEEYEYTLFYPLYTGTGWAGAIGRGRITVVPERQSGDWNSRPEFESISMPDGQRLESHFLEPLEEMTAMFSWDKTLLSEFTNSTYYRALLWEFENFEPVITRSVWFDFYPFPEGSDEFWMEMYLDEGDSVMSASAIRIRLEGPETDL